MTTNDFIHDRFKIAIYPSLLMGLLTNVYISTILIMLGATNVLYSPIIGSIIFIACFIGLKSNKISSKLAFLVTCYTVSIEILVHSHVLGWDCGFFYFIFLLPMVFLLNSSWKQWMIVFFNGTIVLFFFVMRYYYVNETGTYPISEAWTMNLNLLNALATGAVVIVILIFFSRTIYTKDEALIAANTELEKQNTEISDQHRHLQILLKEVHHRVKNNLQIISSLMSLHSRSVKDPNVVKILNESRRRIEAIALIHQKLYQGDDANQVDFRSYLNEFMNWQQTMYPHVLYKIDSEKANLSLDTSVPLGLIISEMITNSIKHAFEGIKNPEVRILLIKNQNEYELTVSDNGCGLSDDFDLNHPESLGTEIIMALVEQIDAVITHSNDDGALFHLTFQDA